MIDRQIFSDIKKSLFQGKVIIIYGPRQVGKTTLSKEILRTSSKEHTYLNCDEPDIRELLKNRTSTELKSIIGTNQLVVIDEAQRVENIGITLKLLIDTFPEIQIIATGSSSFELANKINEPLTGRKIEYHLYPFSIYELKQQYSHLELTRLVEERMMYGSYPVVFNVGINEKIRDLKVLVDSYLFKDIFNFGSIKKPDVLVKLLKALALQIGSQVSYTELANLIGADKKTIESYISILEKAFIIFRYESFARNIRNELKFSKKIYFYDTGVRNALINNFNPLELRQDTGALWENFLLAERQKYISNNGLYRNVYFWRNHAQAEIDYIEEYDGKLHAYEFKWGNKTAKVPKAFADAYPGSSFEVVTREHFLEFVM